MALSYDPSRYSTYSTFRLSGYLVGSCGYCKTAGSSGSYYTFADQLTPEHYQKLIDRSWRRSGTILYKPDQKRSCCPHYTIRLPVDQLRLQRDYRKAVNRWNNFVLGDAYQAKAAKIHPKSKEEKKREHDTFEPRIAIHASELSHLYKDIKPDHEFTVTLEDATFSEEKWKLYSEYQQTTHKEPPSECTRDRFEGFLCSSPLMQEVRDIEGQKVSLGSFHQLYRLDGKLIAMSVLDILPHAVSAVYFIISPEFEKWDLGKISAIREATLAMEKHLGFYYMGYYIHDCQKMRYKDNIKPQHVLDPESNDWDLLDDEFRSLLDQKKYVSLSRERRSPHQTLDPTTVSAQEVQSHGEGIIIPVERGISGIDVPGALEEAQLQNFDFDSILVRIDESIVAPITALTFWNEEKLLPKGGGASRVQRAVVELVSCIGTEVAEETIIDLRG